QPVPGNILNQLVKKSLRQLALSLPNPASVEACKHSLPKASLDPPLRLRQPLAQAPENRA
ncbi:hypothetical protein N7650_07090, partial [Pseudomonas sp. GD04058]|uniref:hypothetical protein n=1 Tax=Pseudomonas sp. GD04058 TaxID=2975429 RepID=UPI00244A6BBC